LEEFDMRNGAFAIINGKVLDSDKKAFFERNILISDGKIVKISTSDITETEAIIDAEGKYIIPGLIDMHTHGALGIDMPEAYHFSADDICRLMRDHYIHYGVTTVFPTYITVTLDELKKASDNIYAVSRSGDNPVNIFGIHSEGVFLSHEKKGAHDETLLRKPDIEEIEYIFSGFPGGKHVLSIAPEVDNAFSVIDDISKDTDVVVSMGHSNADYDTALKSIKAGVKHITHLFNAMTTFTHRTPGIVGAALNSDVSVELIVDTFHVDKSLYDIIWNLKKRKLCFITDCLSAGGLSNGEHTLGGKKIIYKDNLCYLEDGTIAGSVLELNKGVWNVYTNSTIPLWECVNCATLNPATAIGVDDKKGSIEVGKEADLVVLDNEFNVLKTIIGGKIKYEA